MGMKQSGFLRRTKWENQEKREALKFGGKRQPGSGCGKRHKGDVKSPEFLIECKRTDKNSITVKAAWITKILEEAIRAGKEPVIALEIGDVRAYLMPEHVFDYLKDR